MAARLRRADPSLALLTPAETIQIGAVITTTLTIEVTMTLLATGCLLPVNICAEAGRLVAHSATASSGETARRAIRVISVSLGASL